MPASLSTRGVAFRVVKGENWTETTPAEKGLLLLLQLLLALHFPKLKAGSKATERAS